MFIPLYFLTFVISLVTQFFMPAEASAIPLLVSKNDLAPALSLFNITLTIAQALGFLVVGGLLTVLFPSFSLSFRFIHVHVQSFDLLFSLVAIFYLICVFLQLRQHSALQGDHAPELRLSPEIPRDQEQSFTSVLSLLRSRTGVNFLSYK